MLKIKDDVDLKELEKYGFIEENGEYFNYVTDSRHRIGVVVFQEHRNYNGILLKKKSRTISITTANKLVLDVIYDLIKADLVEKIEEKR